MPNPVIRIRQLATTKKRSGLLPVSPATIWRWSRDPNSKFPKPFKLGDGTTVWDAALIDSWLVQKSSGV